MNPYRVLGVEDKAPLDVCKKAYRTLSRKFHPDNGGDPEKFGEISKAWTLIENGTAEQMILMGNTRNKFLHHNTLFSFSLS